MDNNNDKKKEQKMNPTLIKAIVDMIKEVSSLCKAALDAADPNKYVKSVNELNEGVSDTYSEMREIIVNNEAFTAEEKLRRLEELAEKEHEAKRICGEAIKGNRESVTKVVMSILAGFLTCGVSFAPSIVKKFKVAMTSKEQLPETVVDDIIVIDESQISIVE